MDISAHPKLDPKLKETYDRIMGTSVGAKTHPTQATGSPAAPHVPAPTKIAATPAKQELTEHSAPPAQHLGSASSHLSHIAYNASATPKKEVKVHDQEKTDSFLFPIILGACGVIFFVFYAIFWMSYYAL